MLHKIINKQNVDSFRKYAFLLFLEVLRLKYLTKAEIIPNHSKECISFCVRVCAWTNCLKKCTIFKIQQSINSWVNLMDIPVTVLWIQEFFQIKSFESELFSSITSKHFMQCNLFQFLFFYIYLIEKMIKTILLDFISICYTTYN